MERITESQACGSSHARAISPPPHRMYGCLRWARVCRLPHIESMRSPSDPQKAEDLHERYGGAHVTGYLEGKEKIWLSQS